MPLAAIGSLAGHQLGYRAVSGPHRLERTGHGYLEYAPLGVGILLAVALLGFAGLVVRRLRRRPPRPGAPTLLVTLLPPLAFLIQEHVERAVVNGGVPWATLTEAPVVVGLLLQAPFALAAAHASAWLGRMAIRVAESIRPAPPARTVVAALPVPISVAHPPRPAVPARGYTERGPPTDS